MAKHSRAGGGNPDQGPGKRAYQVTPKGHQVIPRGKRSVWEILFRLGKERHDRRQG